MSPTLKIILIGFIVYDQWLRNLQFDKIKIAYTVLENEVTGTYKLTITVVGTFSLELPIFCVENST